MASDLDSTKGYAQRLVTSPIPWTLLSRFHAVFDEAPEEIAF